MPSAATYAQAVRGQQKSAKQPAPPPRSGDPNAIYFDFTEFRVTFDEAKNILRGKYLDQVRAIQVKWSANTIILSFKNEEAAERALETGLTYQDQNIPMGKAAPYGKKLLPVQVANYTLKGDEDPRETLTRFFETIAPVHEIRLNYFKDTPWLDKTAIVVLDITDKSEAVHTMPRCPEQLGETAYLYWPRAKPLCAFCKETGHYKNQCVKLRIKQGKPVRIARNNRQAPAPIEVPAPPPSAQPTPVGEILLEPSGTAQTNDSPPSSTAQPTLEEEVPAETTEATAASTTVHPALETPPNGNNTVTPPTPEGKPTSHPTVNALANTCAQGNTTETAQTVINTQEILTNADTAATPPAPVNGRPNESGENASETELNPDISTPATHPLLSPPPAHSYGTRSQTRSLKRNASSPPPAQTARAKHNAPPSDALAFP